MGVIDIWFYLIDNLLHQPRFYTQYHQVGMAVDCLYIRNGNMRAKSGKLSELGGSRISDSHRHVCQLPHSGLRADRREESAGYGTAHGSCAYNGNFHYVVFL